jgi:1-acyl-sn-glycerol-3-phosphate acyltransferase
VNEFQDGAFRVAQHLEIPIVPVSIVGAHRHHLTGDWMFWPATITIHLHGTIDTTGMSKEEVPELRRRVRETVERPVEEFLAEEKTTS